ncbi:MAG: hypothetical protein ACXWLD_10975 [Rhizomicrobium sp.]
MTKRLGFVMIGLLFVAAAVRPASAAMTPEQARAYCAKKAQANAAANRQQLWADRCVQQVLASQKK